MFLAQLLVIAAQVHAPFAACAWVRAENDSAGAGFIVDVEKRLLVTCRHVVAERTKVDVFLPWIRDGELVTDRREYLRQRDTLRARKLLVSGTVLKTSDELDLALIELDALPPNAIAVTLSARTPRPGEPLRVVGNRLDLDTVFNFTSGPLRASGALADGYFWRGKKLALNAPVLIGQLPIEEGDSGGPVFDARGEVVGMNIALRRQCPLAAVVLSSDAIRQFRSAKAAPKKKPAPAALADTLTHATVWVKPTATNTHAAGVLIDKNLVLTCAHGVSTHERVGVALPLRAGDTWTSERAEYRDPLSLQLRGAWRSGTVLACDRTRDLALIRLDAACEYLKPVPLANSLPQPGDALHTMNHPGGLEFAWVYAGGSVRQRGRLTLDTGENARRVAVLVCQLPAHGNSPGGPILNAKGELVGVVAQRESTQMVAYAATGEEIHAFLDVAWPDRPAQTFAGLMARIEEFPQQFACEVARGLAKRAEQQRLAGRFAEARHHSDTALSLDATCTPARLCLARMLPPEQALSELEAAMEKGTFHREAILLHAELAVGVKDFRKARGDLERILEVFPADAEARQRLANVLLLLGEDAKAAVAIGDTLRADAKRLAAVAGDLLAQSEMLQQKFPDAPAVAVEWLTKALGAAMPHTKAKAQIEKTLKAARAAQSDEERLRVLRDGVRRLNLPPLRGRCRESSSGGWG